LIYSILRENPLKYELRQYNFNTGEDTWLADWATNVEFSPDGSQIAYFAWPQGVGEEKMGLWIMNADGSNPHLVASGALLYPSWSPAGNELAIQGGLMDQAVIIIAGTEATNPWIVTEGEYPAWSRTGRIAFRHCFGSDCGLWTINPDGQGLQRLTTGGGDGGPAWSPDSSKVAFISKDDGNWEIYVINADGTGKTRLTNSPTSDGLPTWSPDGKWIAFRSDRDGKWALYVMRYDGSDVRRIVDAPVLPLWWFEKMSWKQ